MAQPGQSAVPPALAGGAGPLPVDIPLSNWNEGDPIMTIRDLYTSMRDTLNGNYLGHLGEYSWSVRESAVLSQNSHFYVKTQ